MSKVVIALLSDFGDRDGYVGTMKGVISSIFSDLIMIDIAHHIPPQDIRHGSWVLDKAFDCFPEGTFFLCVIDPDVGSREQKKLVIYFENLKKGLVLPDNGLPSRVIRRYPNAKCFSIENNQFFRNAMLPSQTFHGRDIYAPVAAHIAKAFSNNTLSDVLSIIGSPIKHGSVYSLKLNAPEKKMEGVITGEVDLVDTYGNLITNIPSHWLTESDVTYEVSLMEQTWKMPFVFHYTERSSMVLVAGSHGNIEIVLPMGSAQKVFDIQPGLFVTLKYL